MGDFSRDQFSPEKRSWIMSRVKGKDTTPEIEVRRELWCRGMRYRTQNRGLPGKPDIVFPRARVVVFIDGAFWHGKKLSLHRLDQMSAYWRTKIRQTVERDALNNKRLQDMGYLVLRFLERDVLRNTSTIADEIEKVVRGEVRERPNTSP